MDNQKIDLCPAVGFSDFHGATFNLIESTKKPSYVKDFLFTKVWQLLERLKLKIDNTKE